MLNVFGFNRNLRNLKRTRTIFAVLAKYGLSHLLDALHVSDYLLAAKIMLGRRSGQEIERLSTQVRLRLAMEELGPTFIKLGQLLSTRPDLIPADYADELGKLQDQVTPIPFAPLAAQIESALQQPLNVLYAFIDEIPLAAGSIAQVHRARLHSGEEVVIKVRRPDIEGIIETDLDILASLAAMIEKHDPSLAHYELSGVVRELRRVLRNEINLTHEGQIIKRFATYFAKDRNVRLPQVYAELTAETVLTLEYIDGIKVSDRDALIEKGYQPEKIAHNGAAFFLKQVLDFGIFHGDPHPGNFFILEGGVICMLDFGMVGHLSEDVRDYLVNLLLAVLGRDPERIVNLLSCSGDLPDEVNLPNLRHDLAFFIDNYYDIPLHEINTGRLLDEFFGILSLYRIRFSPDLMLLAKALVIIEGIGRKLDPDFNMIVHLKPFMEKIVREKVSPAYLGKEASRVLISFATLFKNLPRDLQAFINRLNHNRFKIDLEHRGLDRLINDLDRSSNRISFSLLIAALIIGSSLIMQTEKGPMLFGFPALGFIGYSIAGFLGLWLAIAILRSGRL
ncbi:MAG: AarF/UbiB family protein [Desulfuromonadales bacterium]|nr:AarF/UbiB family protein [Desulfuromonadales bacterium]